LTNLFLKEMRESPSPGATTSTKVIASSRVGGVVEDLGRKEEQQLESSTIQPGQPSRFMSGAASSQQQKTPQSYSYFGHN